MRAVTRALLVLALIAAAATPQPARALLLPDQLPPSCAPSDAIVQMPCASEPPQLQMVRSGLVRSLVSMNCRVTGVRFNLAGIPIAAERGAGLIAAAIVRPTWQHVRVEQVCQPAYGDSRR